MNETEKTLYRKYEEQGYDVIHTGVPDLILLKDGKIEFIEIKAAADLLRESQMRAVTLLRNHGFKVRIERIPDVKPSALLKEWRENHNPTQSSPNQTTPRQSTPNQPNPGQANPGQSPSKEVKLVEM